MNKKVKSLGKVEINTSFKFFVSLVTSKKFQTELTSIVSQNKIHFDPLPNEKDVDMSMYKLSHVVRKIRSSGFPTRSDTNRAVQPRKMAGGLKFRI